jgi:hypothetical protein
MNQTLPKVGRRLAKLSDFHFSPSSAYIQIITPIKDNTVTYPGIAWLIRLTRSNLLDLYTTGHNSSQLTDTLSSSSDWTLHWKYSDSWIPLYSFVLLYTSPHSFNSPDCALFNSSARTPRKTPSSVVKNACLLVRYLLIDVLLLLRA